MSVAALVLVALVLLGTAAGAGAVAAAARRDLHALATAHVKLEGRVAALAPAQLDALDAAVTARLAALDAAQDAGAALAAIAPPQPVRPPERARASQVAEPPDPTLAEAEAILERHGVGPWDAWSDTPAIGGSAWRRGPDGAVARVFEASDSAHSHWTAAVGGSLPTAERGGWMPRNREKAKRRATIALAALLLRRDA